VTFVELSIWFNLFNKLEKVLLFLSGTGYMFSRAWYRLHVSPSDWLATDIIVIAAVICDRDWKAFLSSSIVCYYCCVGCLVSIILTSIPAAVSLYLWG